MNQTKEHYSYRIYADPQIAQAFDADRFGGPIGELIKKTQERVVFSQLPSVNGWKVMDLGAGTGRFTIPFLASGAEVAACDASQQMLEVLQNKTKDPKLRIFVADAHELQFGDQTFDCSFSFRMLLHVIDWKKALSELCRVSRDWVVFDFPPRHGFLFFAPWWHRVHRIFSKNVQQYRTFRLQEIMDELLKNGFDVVSSDYGFFLPLTVHRTIKSPSFTGVSERFFSTIGLTRIAGSPITVFARRKK